MNVHQHLVSADWATFALSSSSPLQLFFIKVDWLVIDNCFDWFAWPCGRAWFN